MSLTCPSLPTTPPPPRSCACGTRAPAAPATPISQPGPLRSTTGRRVRDLSGVPARRGRGCRPAAQSVAPTVPEPRPAPVETGSAGSSAQREYERRKARREGRIRVAHPRLGGLILALSDEPQTTTAWAKGARGEEVLGPSLDTLGDRGIRVLHDRRIPRTRANIDHIAVCPAGMFVIDAKRYRGRPDPPRRGRILRPRTAADGRVTRLHQGRRGRARAGGPGSSGARQQDSPTSRARHALLRRRGLAAVRGWFTIDAVDVLWPRRPPSVSRPPDRSTRTPSTRCPARSRPRFRRLRVSPPNLALFLFAGSGRPRSMPPT